MAFQNTQGGHFTSSVALETEPARSEFIVTMVVVFIKNVSGFSVKIGQVLVALAFYNVWGKNITSVFGWE